MRNKNMKDEYKNMKDEYLSACVSLLFIELSRNLRYADDKLNSESCDAIRFATQTIEILDDHDNIKELDCWINHRKQLRDWAQDILLKGRNKEKENGQ